MKIIIERSALLKTLGHVQSVVERRNTIPILANVLLDAQGDQLRMSATDLDIQITDSTPAQIQEAGSTTVPAQTFHDIVRKLPEGSQVQLELENGRLKIIAGRSRFHLPVLAADEFPNIARGDIEHSFSLTTSGLQEAFERTRYAMSSEETRYYLNGIFMHVVDGQLIAAATDGHRLARTLVDTGEAAINGMPDIIVPRKTVGEIVKLLGEYEGDVEIGVARTKITFDIGHLSLVSKTVDGAFPDYQRVIPQGNEISVKAEVKALNDAVDRVAAIASEKTRAVRMKIGNGYISLIVDSPDTGTANDEIVCDANGEIEIGFNSRYLTETLKQIDAESVEMRFDTPGAPVLIKDHARPDDAKVIMPLRV